MNNNSNEVFVENFTNKAGIEANILINHALMLSKAYETNSKEEVLYALDSYLKLWVEIETSVKNAKNLLPENLKSNIVKLSKFVERTVLSKGVTLSKEDVKTLVNVNMQVATGLLEQTDNYLAIEEAISLLQCTIKLSNAKETKNSSDLVSALDENLKLWVYIKTMAKKKDSKISTETKNNLIKLADYMSAKTIEVGQNLSNFDENTLEHMINTNLQVTEGLVSNRVA
ncbi:MAG: flagellar biosynthesis regulator FlaF [Alphaproteobacteria bacterium]|nr:flagellar biosynthesis regulator FlaF [Alphaproteobacteria bacterium]